MRGWDIEGVRHEKTGREGREDAVDRTDAWTPGEQQRNVRADRKSCWIEVCQQDSLCAATSCTQAPSGTIVTNTAKKQ